ncbi:hypothetical protein HHI36_007912 [Cryptolaemus montrouzieri]|uniref:RING-CH-type domain-containing protein n=1 Tax=Cryptolaemus montrouzieri TaxID=559131 RepID=A0ABD2MQV3_9CUCU
MSSSFQNRNQLNDQGSVISVLCRICYGADSNEELITPCRCKGTVAYVHRSCLETWLAEANATNCELCHQVFHTERTPKYTTCQSLWKWFRYQPTANEVGRGIIGDLLACAAITPMAIIITYVCLFSSDYYNQKKFQAMAAAKWTSVSLLVMIGIMLVGYYMWVFSIIKLHMNVWYNWWQRECIVRYIPPPQPRTLYSSRLNKRGSTTISTESSEANVNPEAVEIIDIETVDSRSRLLSPIRPVPQPHKAIPGVALDKKQILSKIEERKSETVINIVQSLTRNMEVYVTGSRRVLADNQEEEEMEEGVKKTDKTDSNENNH